MYTLDYEREVKLADRVNYEELINELAKNCIDDQKISDESLDDLLKCYYITEYNRGREVLSCRADLSDFYADIKQKFIELGGVWA